MTIKINPNSDCAGELDALKELLPQNKSYTFGEWSYSAIVAAAIDELYDKIVAQKKAGENQRKSV